MKLRDRIVLIVFIQLAFTTIYGQGKEDKSYPLFNIRLAYQRINNYPNYKIVTIPDTEDFLGHATDNGGSLEGYYKGDSLKKIVEWIGLSNRVIQREYYFDNDKLFFVYCTESRYRYNDSTQSFDYSKLDREFSGRYYFNDEKLFDTILSDKEHDATKEKDAVSFLKSSRDYSKLLKAKKNS